MDALSIAKIPFNLKIIPVSDSGVPNGVPFIAMFNPETLAVREGVDWKNNAPPTANGSDVTFQRTWARTFSIDILLDGTGVNTEGVKIPVTAQVLLFRATTSGVKGDVHRPSYLLVQYGTFISTCVLNSSTITYTMFDLTGLPIRAKINATFTERTPSGLMKVLSMLSSPDLTHEVVVKDGDTLPLLTHAIYKDQRYYLQVARVNGLTNFRDLKPGTRLIFPPLSNISK